MKLLFFPKSFLTVEVVVAACRRGSSSHTNLALGNVIGEDQSNKKSRRTNNFPLGKCVGGDVNNTMTKISILMKR